MGIRTAILDFFMGEPPASSPEVPVAVDVGEPAAPHRLQEIEEAGLRNDAIGSRQMSSILNTLTGMGGTNDKGAVGKPNTGRTSLNARELAALYRYNTYAARGVDQYPKDGTRKGITLTDDTEDPAPLADDFKRLGVMQAFKEGATWGRLFGAGAVLVVTEDDAEDVTEPLTLDNIKRVVNLVPLDAGELYPRTWGGDPMGDYFREVETYQVVPARVVLKDGAIYHASRVLYFPGIKLPPSLRSETITQMDESVLNRAWDAIRNLTSIDQSAATVAQEGQIKVLSTPGIKSNQASDTINAYKARMLLFATALSNVGMAVLGADEKLTVESPNLTGWGQLSPQARLALAAVFEMPQTLLFGETPSGLSTDGESWRKMWSANVADWQESKLRGNLEWLIQLIYSSDGGAVPDKWSMEFNPLDELTEEEMANIKLVNAERDTLYIDRAVYLPGDVTTARFSGEGYNEVTNTELAEVDEEAMDAMRKAMEGGEGAAAALPTGAAGEQIAKLGLNGAQMNAILTVVDNFKRGILDKPAAIELITQGLPSITPESATIILGEQSLPPDAE